jgi:hypothetical protein
MNWGHAIYHNIKQLPRKTWLFPAPNNIENHCPSSTWVYRMNRFARIKSDQSETGYAVVSTTMIRSITVVHFVENRTIPEQQELSVAMNHAFETAMLIYAKMTQNFVTRKAMSTHQEIYEEMLNEYLEENPQVVRQQQSQHQSEEEEEEQCDEQELQAQKRRERLEWTEEENKFFEKKLPCFTDEHGKVDWSGFIAAGKNKFSNQVCNWNRRSAASFMQKRKNLKKQSKK